MTQVGNRPDHGAFIPAYLDDYPLKPCEFRVYARIMRRAGTDKAKHFESIPNLAKSCGMNQKTARNAVRVLKALGMISVTQRQGYSSEMYPRHEDDWVPPENVESIREATLSTPTKLGRGQNGYSQNREGSAPKTGRGGDPHTAGGPLPKEVDEGTPIKVLPEGNPIKAGEQQSFASHPEPSTDARPRVGVRPPAVDVMAWMMSHNQHKPKRWAAVRKLGPKDIEHVQRVIEFYDGDQREALECHRLAMEHIKRCDNAFWRDEFQGDFLSLVHSDKMSQRIAAWAELERARLESLSNKPTRPTSIDPTEAARLAIEAEMAAQLGGAA